MRLTQQQLETHLWGAANILRGKTAGQDYKNYILSLMFYKRLCDQWENETDEAIAEQERQQGRPFTDAQKLIFRMRGEHRFNLYDGSRWGDVLAASTHLGEKLTQAMRAVADANDELKGVFTVDWAQPAPDGSGKPLIPNEVVHALIQHFNVHDLSNASVPPDVLGRAYEYLIKQFADDAGAKAGEFFTPPEVVDTLVRILAPRPGDTINDPTCGSGGMLVHAADYLRETGHEANAAQYFGQEMNWGNASIGKINSVLHGLEARIAAGASTITDPAFTAGGQLRKFSLVLANFPFSDEFWWLKPEQFTDDKKKKDRLKKEVFGKEGYKDPYGRFGRGTQFRAPPAGYGDYAFILHILASLTDQGRAGIVCPQGVLFRGQAEVEDETGEFDDDGNPVIKRRKADDEHLIRRALVEARVVDAVISLPLNVFYGAGVPACLLILNKQRPIERRDQVLLVYAARHFRELSNQNELRPQDVMRMLVHVQAYGDAAKVPALVAQHSGRLREQINRREFDQIERLELEYAEAAARAAKLATAAAEARAELPQLAGKVVAHAKAEAALAKLDAQATKAAAKVAERDEKIAEARRRADDDRRDVAQVGSELGALYGDADELLKHARVVGIDEIAENEFNLNIPRYVDTFEPEPELPVADALQRLRETEESERDIDLSLLGKLTAENYGVERHGETKSGGKRLTPWPIKRLDEVANVESGITLGKDPSGFKQVELPYLRVANVQDGYLDLASMKTVKVRVEEVDRYRLEPGDVLMTEGGDLDKLGRGAIWDGQIPDCLHQNHIFRVRADRSQLDPHYFACIVESDIAKRYFTRVAKRTTNLASTNKTQVRAFRFPLPPLDEQREIVELVQASKAKIRALEQKQAALRQLKQSLMHDLLTGQVRVDPALFAA